MTRGIVDVAVGVLIRGDGRFLLASRPAGKPYAGYWEFPGGKLETGEAVAHALARELREELGIEIGAAHPWVVREFEYPHAHVRLHFRRVFEWQGSPHAREGQQLKFAALTDLPDGPLLPATIPVLRWLDLPPVLAITDAAELGTDRFYEQLDLALARGLRFVLFREPKLGAAGARAAFEKTLRRVRDAGARLIVSSRHPGEWAADTDGVHLTSRDLLALRKRPDHRWVGASVHDRETLEHATRLGVDFAMLGQVATTPSHPDTIPLGWVGFADCVANTAIPVYGVGGLSPTDLVQAITLGAHGIASQRSVWTSYGSFGSASGGISPASSAVLPVIE